jgi:hypothetical protein
MTAEEHAKRCHLLATPGRKLPPNVVRLRKLRSWKDTYTGVIAEKDAPKSSKGTYEVRSDGDRRLNTRRVRGPGDDGSSGHAGGMEGLSK